MNNRNLLLCALRALRVVQCKLQVMAEVLDIRKGKSIRAAHKGGKEEPCLEMASMCLFRLRVKGPAAWPDQVEG